MTRDKCTDLASAVKQSVELGKKLLSFREGLPTHHRRALNRLIGGAVAAGNVVQRLRSTDKEDSFSYALTTFENGLPEGQREGFRAMLSAGALAWGLAADQTPEVDTKPIYFWHWVHLARTAAVIIAGAVTVVLEATDDDEEQLVPVIDLPDIPH